MSKKRKPLNEMNSSLSSEMAQNCVCGTGKGCTLCRFEAAEILKIQQIIHK